MTDIKLAYITTPSHEDAEKIAKTVVTERLAACANILPGITSIFEWENRLCRETEVLLVLKTTSEMVEKLTDRIKDIHPYDCPCIATLPIEAGNKDFLNWVRTSCETNP